MNIFRRYFFMGAAILSTSIAGAQTADEIIAKNIEASGGKEKLSTIKSVRMESNVEVMGTQAPSVTTIVDGKGYRNESDFNGQKIISAYTDKGGWSVNPLAGGTEPQAMSEEQFKSVQDQIYIVPLLNYAARGAKAELLGQEKVGTVNAHKIKLTESNGTATTYYFDPATYNIIQTTRTAEAMGQSMEITISYSDYKKTDFGWVTAETMNMDFGGQFSMAMKTGKIEVNPVIDPAIFEMKK